MSANAPTIHVVDDDASFLLAVSRMLRAHGYRVRTFSSAAEFLGQRDPAASGCVVADLKMPGMGGLELQQALAITHTPLPILFLTGNGDIPSSVQAMRFGAEDFLAKTAPRPELIDAIRRALSRDVNERDARRRRQKLVALFEILTEREREVFGHVVRGRLNKQIAAELGIHERTVKLHRTSITTKLGVPSAAELTHIAHELGFFDDS